MNLPGHDKWLEPPDYLEAPCTRDDRTLTGSTLDNLKQAIATMPRELAQGEFCHYRKEEVEYCAIGWLLHKAGVADKTLYKMSGYISDPHNNEYIWLLVRHYGLTKMEARTIEDTNDHKSRAQLEEVLQIILREKEKVEKEREEVA